MPFEKIQRGGYIKIDLNLQKMNCGGKVYVLQLNFRNVKPFYFLVSRTRQMGRRFFGLKKPEFSKYLLCQRKVVELESVALELHAYKNNGSNWI